MCIFLQSPCTSMLPILSSVRLLFIFAILILLLGLGTFCLHNNPDSQSLFRLDLFEIWKRQAETKKRWCSGSEQIADDNEKEEVDKSQHGRMCILTQIPPTASLTNCTRRVKTLHRLPKSWDLQILQLQHYLLPGMPYHTYHTYTMHIPYIYHACNTSSPAPFPWHPTIPPAKISSGTLRDSCGTFMALDSCRCENFLYIFVHQFWSPESRFERQPGSKQLPQSLKVFRSCELRCAELTGIVEMCYSPVAARALHLSKTKFVHPICLKQSLLHPI